MAFLKQSEQSPETLEREAMEKYRINELSDPRDRADMERILHHLANNVAMKLGNTNRALEQELNVMADRYTYAIFEQNNIIIRQLDRLNRNLENKNTD